MHASDGGPEAGEILAKPQGSGFEEFRGHDSSAVLHFFCEVRRFAAGCCASVEDTFTWLWVEKIACEEGARVLNVGEALLQPFSRDALRFENFGMEVGALEG